MRWWIRLGLVSCAGIGVCAAMWIDPHPALAQDLERESVVRYEVDHEAGRLRITSNIVATNTKPNTRSGNTITQYYFDGLTFSVPNAAVGITASGDRGGVTFEVGQLGPPSDPFKEVTLHFGRNLFYRSRQSIEFAYDIVAPEPRSDDTVRVNDAFAAFPVIVWGDPGRTRVEVVASDGFEIDIWQDGGSALVPARVEGQIVYALDAIDDPSDFFAFVTMRNDALLRTSQVTVDDRTFDLLAWPDDPSWSYQVSRALTAGSGTLRELIGFDWDLEQNLRFVESFDPTLAGYGGWYITASDTVEIGEWADSHLVIHELSHAWFNTELFGERWITEGLADTYAERTVQDSDLAVNTKIERPETVSTSRLFSFPLNTWDEVLTGAEGDSRREAYGYDASWWVVGSIADEIGFDRMAEVLEAANDSTTAYRGSAEPETVASYDGWKRFLDLVEEIGGSERAEELFSTFVLDQDIDLSERYDARDRYSELVAGADPWALPIYVREPMATWEFATASGRIDEASAAVERRDDVAAAAQAEGLDAPDVAREAFEGTTDGFDELHRVLDDVETAITVVVASEQLVSSDQDLFTRIGLWNRDQPSTSAVRAAFEDGDFERSEAALEEIRNAYDEAASTGRTRTLVGVGTAIVLILGVGVGISVIVVRRRRSTSQDDDTQNGTPEPTASAGASAD